MKICYNCKNCEVRSEGYKCKLHSRVNHITGSIIYDYCIDHNIEGECKEYEEKEPLWKRFIEAMQKIIRQEP